MNNRPILSSVTILAVFVIGTCVLSIDRADAQNAIPFTHIVIDPSPPLQSHCKAVGDIDGDGYPDVLVAGAKAGDGFFWYRYPNWTKYTIVPPGTGFTTDMQVGDVDGDGDLDAIIPKGSTKGNSVFWYENPRPSGDPATDTWIEHSIGVAPSHDVEVGDINNDGKLDVVVRDGPTTVFIQNTPTTWTKNVVNSRSIEGTALGDIDGDGDLDIAINGYWLENPLPSGNPGTDSWNEYVIKSGWRTYSGALIVDLNADGRADVVLSPSETTGRFSWFEGPPSPKSGGWIEHSIDATAEYMHTFKAFDMDLDGDLDLVTAEMSQSNDPDEVSVYLNEGGALSWNQQVVATTGSHNLRVADIGSDGDMDIVGANWQGTTPVDLWQNELNPTVSLDSWERHVIDSNRPWRAIFIDAGDLNGDALPDIVTGGWWYRNPGDPSGAWVRNELGSPLNNMAAVYDFDGDGSLDVLGTQGVGSASNDQFAWARNDGQGSFTILQNIQDAKGDFLQGVAVDRFQNGAGLEVALSWHSSSQDLQRLTLPADPVSQTWTWDQLSSTSQDEEVSSGDIDRDGDIDLLLGTVWMRNDGTSWSAHTLTGTSSVPDRNRLVDINGDGRLDAVIGFEFESKLSWYEQGASATGTWTEHSIANDFYAPMSLDVADLDRDGDLDVVAGEHNLTNPASSWLYVYENDGGGNAWIPHEVYTGDEHHDGAQLIDIDNDGDLDIVSIGWSHDRVHLYENLSNTGGPPANRAPVASFTASPTSGEVPLTVSFDASASFDPDGDNLTYAWDFDDGGTGSGVTANHTFTQTGTYLVRLTVDDGQLTGSATRTVQVKNPPDPTDRLLAHWPLDETSGTTAQDVAGTNNGTLLNGPVWQSGGGQVDGALQFDGVDDLVDLGPVDVEGGSGGMTIAMWARVDAFPIADGRFICKATGVASENHYWMVSTINDTGLRFRLRVGGATTTLVTNGGQIETGQWCHITATYDGSSMRIYKDGVEVASTSATGQVAVNPAVSAALGNQPPGAGQRALDGLLDDVRVYNYALSESEILELANPGGPPPNRPPVASFTANPTSGVVPLAVSFDASASSDPDGDNLTYAWDFDDGGTGSGVTANHTFTQTGSYQVVLTVGDGQLTGNTSQTIEVTSVPDTLVLEMGILQNPYLTQYLDVYLIASEQLNPSTISVTVGNDVVVMELIDAADNVWRGDHELTAVGLINAQACATSVDGHSSCTAATLSAIWVVAGAGAFVASPDNIFSVRVPEGGIARDGYLLVIPSAAALSEEQSLDRVSARAAPDDEQPLPAYSVGPRSLTDGATVTVEFRFEDLTLPGGVELSQVYIEHVGHGPIKSRIDKHAGVIRATSQELGEFALKIGSPGVSEIADGGFARLRQNYPNPFNPSTTIEFEVQISQNIRITIYDVTGRFVVKLLDEEVPAGIGRVGWDGRSDLGEAVGSGVYFVRLETAEATATRKLMLVR